MLVWHIRIAMDDMISYIDNKNYKMLPFPEGYWPKSDSPENEQEWIKTLQDIEDRLTVFEKWIDSGDLFAPLEANPEHTLYRQITIIGQHNSYHIAQIIDLRQLLGVPARDY